MSCNGCTACDKFTREGVEQPPIVEFTADGIFIKQMDIAKAFSYVPQHSHTYDHTTLLAVGSASVWKDGEYLGDFTAPDAIMIPANTKHIFKTLVDNTVFYCIHKLHSDHVEIAEIHNLPGVV